MTVVFEILGIHMIIWQREGMTTSSMFNDREHSSILSQSFFALALLFCVISYVADKRQEWMIRLDIKSLIWWGWVYNWGVIIITIISNGKIPQAEYLQTFKSFKGYVLSF